MADTALPSFENGEKVVLKHPSAKQRKFAGKIGIVVKMDVFQKDPEHVKAHCEMGEMPVKVIFPSVVEGERVCWVPNTKLEKCNP